MSNSRVQLHFLRHAHAGDPMKWSGPDDQRPLSAKGRAQADALGRHLVASGQQFDRVVSSPLVRARQTADLVAARIGLVVIVDDRLAGGLEIDGVEAILRDMDNPGRPILVGHDPDFSDLVARLSGASMIPMRKGALARVDIDRPLAPGAGILAFLLPPELVDQD